MTPYRLLRLGDEEIYRIEEFGCRWWNRTSKWRTTYYWNLWGEKAWCEFDSLEMAERHLNILETRDRIAEARMLNAWSKVR